MKRSPFLALCLLACACHHEDAVVADPLSGAKDLIKAHDYPGAVQKLEDLRAQKGEDPEVVLLLMQLYNRQGDQARAILRGRAALAAHPDAKDVYVPLAQLYMFAGQNEVARDTLLEGRKHGADEKDVAFQLGTCLARLNDLPGARAEYARAQAAGSEEHLVQYNLALIALQEQDRPKARAMFEGIVAKHPDYAPARRELAHVILDQAILDSAQAQKVDVEKVNQAMNMLWDVKEKLKDDWRLSEAMGDGWLLLGDYDAALAAYTEALKFGQNPKSVEDRYRLAKTRQKAAKEANAKAAPPTPPADMPK